uniref:Uncharacterized protein n=1 Tax=Beihai dimarhabodovirus 1 TaxID=2116357 RepID=A0A2P1GMS2_9RHAB|nr:hypothetical protein [Beihai dimarhabodovirus 1]
MSNGNENSIFSARYDNAFKFAGQVREETDFKTEYGQEEDEVSLGITVPSPQKRVSAAGPTYRTPRPKVYGSLSREVSVNPDVIHIKHQVSAPITKNPRKRYSVIPARYAISEAARKRVKLIENKKEGESWESYMSRISNSVNSAEVLDYFPENSEQLIPVFNKLERHELEKLLTCIKEAFVNYSSTNP